MISRACGNPDSTTRNAPYVHMRLDSIFELCRTFSNVLASILTFTSRPLKQTLFHIQCGPFITLCLESIGMDRIKIESCYKGSILQALRNYRK